ncbi:inducible nitrate reductase [NADH] 2-like [Senna tora]|uniref:Nitrate reductase n=1 Tax=Senna tora TaxID=362788 RepID=A0A834T9S8_9FABA|nr:inducible nitrate reductase [NADH] 2-like [Senna tora]
MAASVDNRQYSGLKPPLNGYSPSNNPNTTISQQQYPPFYSDSDSETDDEENPSDEWQTHIRNSLTQLEPSVLDPRDEATPDRWIPRNPSLVRLTGKHPFNSEAPLSRLMHHGFITPVPLHYVRNHGPVPMARWDQWTIDVCGLLNHPTTFTMDQLVKEFPTRQIPVTLVCAGNRRKEQNTVKQSIGFNWGAAAVSTSVWGGVPLRYVLKRCGIYGRRKGALHVCFEGAEDLPGGGGSKYGTSIAREIALDPSRDILLAYMQNGELLSPDHGFPVRVIVPGFIGGRMVKWLRRIVVAPQESHNYYHYRDNRVFPSHVDIELANAEAWWYKPEYIINELNINSVITTPAHEEILPINSWTTQRPYVLKGYAYSGGGRKVTRVEVTMDGGETWQMCRVEQQEKPNKYGKYWCWCFWSLEVEVLDLLAAKHIAVRAWDEALNTQPHKLIWNLMGMMNNCWFRVKINMCKAQKDEIGVVFEHPTLPGNESGGWMAKERYMEKSSDSNQLLKKSVSTPFMNTSSNVYSLSQLRAHNTPDSAWILIHGNVYDCTRFLQHHPGGADSILLNAGTDCTDEFDAIHSDKAKKMLDEYRIGELMTTPYTSDSDSDSIKEPNMTMTTTLTPSPRAIALNPPHKIPCKLLSKTSISHDVSLFRFALPSEDQPLGLPVGKHIYLCATIEGKLCMRAYTPTTSVDEVGYFDLVVKIYYKNVHPKFPNGGLMTQHLESLPIGSVLEVKGPLGHIEYTGRGNFLVQGKHRFAKKLAMFAGGSGITPIYQVAQAILKDPEDRTEMHVVYANRTEDDILMREVLDAWGDKCGERFKVWYVVQESKREGWGYSVGFITESVVREHVPEASEDTLALACGPPPMIQFAVQPSLEKIGYDIQNNLLLF